MGGEVQIQAFQILPLSVAMPSGAPLVINGGRPAMISGPSGATLSPTLINGYLMLYFWAKIVNNTINWKRWS